MRALICMLIVCFAAAAGARAQSPNATVTGQVLDSSGAVIAGAEIDVINSATNVIYSTKTNTDGIFLVPDVPPATYRVQVSHVGFKTIVKPDIILNVRDAVALNFSLPVGAISETVTVEGGAPLIDTQDAAVSTIVDRQFAENLPMNGRSFQTLIQLTPGVVVTQNNGIDTGQFSVNGQRASANYWMVDGVSANIGIGVGQTTGNGLGGALGSFSVLGGTNSLVSIDALQEFRIQTSTFAPEFGRTPGAQISIVTRSGTNDFHGTAFEYLRNDLFDANDWFADHLGLPKAKERQNDFGGTFSGPIAKGNTFFFFSYEGLRLRLPETELTQVPDLPSRQAATSTLRPFLNAYPLPNGTDNSSTGVAQFAASFSNPGSLDAYSLRIDHKLGRRLSLFGRFNYAPSQLVQRGAESSLALSAVFPDKITTETATAGLTWVMSTGVVDDFRFNYSRTDSSSSLFLDNFGGAIPLQSLPLPSPFNATNGRFGFEIIALGTTSGALLLDGQNARNEQRQINIVDSASVQKGSHSLKFGVDFRRLSPSFSIPAYAQTPIFVGVSQAETGNALATSITSNLKAALLLRNFGAFAQDTWRMTPRLTLTYGLRWDVDFSPTSISGPSLAAVTGFNITNLSRLALAPGGTPPFATRYGNVAPRFGIAYLLGQTAKWQTVARGGFGVFYDLATAEAGNVIDESLYPYGGFSRASGTFPLTPSAATPPVITPPTATNGEILFGFDPNLELPYTLQWNVSLEQALGDKQSITASYIGSDGRRLIQTASISSPNPNYGDVQLVTNAATSNYEALQIQFQRRLSHGFQTLASYTWSHSIDSASAGSLGSGSNALTALSPASNRGPSDFDIRNALSAGMTYAIPLSVTNSLARTMLSGWSTENVFQVRSAPPVNVYYDPVSYVGSIDGFSTQVRPDVNPGIPLYLRGFQYPGGKAFNPSAFSAPPVNSGTGLPTGQGDLSRNALRGFGAYQWDFALHRDFYLTETVYLQFRAEMFNVLNHPNFAQPIGDLGTPSTPNLQFGQSTEMFGKSLSGTVGSGGLNPLYEVGGSRSVQFALKFQF